VNPLEGSNGERHVGSADNLIREANMTRPIALIATMVCLLPISAQAGIVCRDGYQVVNGQEISTPYCVDNYVAAIARKHGMKVSDAEVRNNPAAKAQVCRFISSDIEVRESCNSSDGRGRR
jgi:hypothetical protein